MPNRLTRLLRHVLPACVAPEGVRTLPPHLNVPSYEMHLRIPESAGEVLRDALAAWTRRPLASPYERAQARLILDRLLAEEMILAGARCADVVNDAAYRSNTC